MRAAFLFQEVAHAQGVEIPTRGPKPADQPCISGIEKVTKVMNYFESLRKRVDLANSDCGRRYGWYMMCGSEKYAELFSPQFEDMFWDKYQMRILINDSEKLQKISSKEFWDNLQEIFFVNRHTGDMVKNAFSAGSTEFQKLEFEEVVSITMRGLYVDFRHPNVIEKAVDRIALLFH